MARCSSGLERDVHEFGWRLSVFETFGDHSEGERLNPRDRFVAVRAIAHHARQGGYFGEPAAVVFAIELNRKRHAWYCNSRVGCLTSAAPDKPRGALGLFAARSIAARG